MKVLITGVNGYIGSNLRNYLQNNGFEVYGITSKESNDPKIFQAEITNAQQIFNILNKIRPEIIVHTAAISSLNMCEENKQLAIKVNVEVTRNFINSITHVNPDIKFVFFSSDYVFDGGRGSYREDDPVNPTTFYGKTKAISEEEIKNNLKNYIICRTAAVFGRGGKFFNFIVNALQQNRVINVYEDAFFSPTYIDYLLDSLKELINIDFKGIIHITEGERLSRYDFALLVAEALGKDKSLIKPIKLPENELIAKDSSLDSEFSRRILNNFRPTIREALHYSFGNLKPPYYYFTDARGAFLGIIQNQEWKEINYIESKKGSVRGNHYHKETVECFFIIDGKIRVTLVDLITNSKKVFIVEKGSIFIVKPNTLHTFEVLEDSKWINMLSKPIKSEPKDFYRPKA